MKTLTYEKYTLKYTTTNLKITHDQPEILPNHEQKPAKSHQQSNSQKQCAKSGLPGQLNYKIQQKLNKKGFLHNGERGNAINTVEGISD